MLRNSVHILRKGIFFGVLGAFLFGCNVVALLRPTTTPLPASTFPAQGQPSSSTPTPAPSPSPTPTPVPTPTPDPQQTFALAERALFYGDWETALRLYDEIRAVATAPEEQAWALLGLGRTYYLARNTTEALRHLRQVVETYPDTAAAGRAHLYLALTYRRLQRYKDEAASWQAFLPHAPEPVIPYVYEWLADALFNAGEYGPAATAYQAALDSNPFPPRVYGLYLGMGRAYQILREWDRALAAYGQALEHAPNDFERAFVLYLTGQVHLERGQTEEGYALYLRVVTEYPKSPYAYKALVALIEAKRPVPDLERGIVDYYAGQYTPALKALRRYLEAHPEPPTATAHYYLGLVYRAQRSYTQALEAWQTVIRRYPGDRLWVRAWEAVAETHARWLQDYQSATETYLAFVDQNPQHPQAPEFLFRAARYQAALFKLEEAASLWYRVATTYPHHERAPRAFLLAGVTWVRLGQPERARDVFFQAGENIVKPYWRAGALLWLGKMEAQQGNLDLARQAWTQAAALDPTGYYSERARDLLEGRAPFARPLAYDTGIDWEAERRQAAQWVRQVFHLPPQEDLLTPGPLAQDARYRRGLWLWQLGFYQEARNEWEDLRKAVYSDPAQTFRLIHEAQRLGMYRTAILAAWRVLELAGLDAFTALTAPPYFNHVRFGPYYAELVVPMAQEYDFHPLFLYALIRQESLFEGFIASRAGALGLMQIIPDTGAYLAELQGWPPNYETEDLLRPLVSLRLGTAYLHQQRKTFNDNLFAALAAYNAGPGNASHWYEIAPQDPDLFLEVVSFDETHVYLRRIYENYAMYYRLYARTP